MSDTAPGVTRDGRHLSCYIICEYVPKQHDNKRDKVADVVGLFLQKCIFYK